jgi:hypothetical protein
LICAQNDSLSGSVLASVAFGSIVAWRSTHGPM